MMRSDGRSPAEVTKRTGRFGGRPIVAEASILAGEDEEEAEEERDLLAELTAPDAPVGNGTVSSEEPPKPRLQKETSSIRRALDNGEKPPLDRLFSSGWCLWKSQPLLTMQLSSSHSSKSNGVVAGQHLSGRFSTPAAPIAGESATAEEGGDGEFIGAMPAETRSWFDGLEESQKEHLMKLYRLGVLHAVDAISRQQRYVKALANCPGNVKVGGKEGGLKKK